MSDNRDSHRQPTWEELMKEPLPGGRTVGDYFEEADSSNDPHGADQSTALFVGGKLPKRPARKSRRKST
jgi:hypothetical protein